MNYLKILFFLIVGFGATHATTQNLNESAKDREEATNNNFVKFLNINEAAIAILDETYEPYFSNLQIREIQTLTGVLPPTNNLTEARNFAREKFSSAVMSFTSKEEAAISLAVSVIKKTLLENNLNIIANHPWKFIKIENWLCGGFAHTRGDYIILSQRHLEYITSPKIDKNSQMDSIKIFKKLCSLLVHEQFHSLQRNFPEKFEALYVNSWNFSKTTVEVDSTILINQLINPDAPNPEWITKYNGSYYWIRTLINPKPENPEMGKDFMDVVYTLESKNNHFHIAKDSLNSPKKQRLLDFTAYTNSFPVQQGLDHPNEISAYMFSKYFISLIENKPPFDEINENSALFSQKYIAWLKNNL